jgi:hypothetical protein
MNKKGRSYQFIQAYLTPCLADLVISIDPTKQLKN